MLPPLPIDAHVDEIVAAVRDRRAAVVVAPPGAGKTTRVPPALAADGPVILLQPRRIAARALARRIAVERGFTLGAEVGWQVRFERNFSPRTRLLVATEGILTARLQSDPLLESFRTVILDEFHERSLHADLALALARQAAAARGDLRVVVMSATLDAGPLADFLGGCPVIDLPGRPHPVQIAHAPGIDPASASLSALDRAEGHVLCFLPGAPEIERTRREVERHLGTRDVVIRPLHGSLDADEQDAALAPSTVRKLILATNLAETSLTVEGVTEVVDSGLHKVLRRDPATGIDRLETERVSRDSAEQRAGRAGRTAPGHALRLWDERDHLRAHREPEIERVDLAAPVLDVLAWGGDPLRFEWFEAPPEPAMRAALELLERLHAVERGRITPLGRALMRLPLHPRLARVLLGSGGSPEAAAACAALSEGQTRHGNEATSSDLLSISDRVHEAPDRTRRIAGELQRQARHILAEAGADIPTPPRANAEEGLRRAVLGGYPDRVARRREPGSPRLLLANGHGAALAAESGVRSGEFLVAVELRAGARGPGSEARVTLASRVEPEWLEPTHVETRHDVDPDSGTVRAVERTLYQQLVLAERAVAADAELAARLVAQFMLERGLGEANERHLCRLRFADLAVDLPGLVRAACQGRTSPCAFDLLAHLPPETRRALERAAPDTLALPSGRRTELDYREDGSVVAAVKLQELFGLGETPRLGARRAPVTLELLAPNGRPVQTTRDLRSFWNNTYPEVRRELRGRYPKHPWPEDPWTATPTARTQRRPR